MRVEIMKIERLDDIHTYASQMIDKFIEYTDLYHSDYVFKVLYRRDGETDFTESYELCEYPYVGGDVYWHTDWYIGQNEVIFESLDSLVSILEYYYDNHPKVKQ